MALFFKAAAAGAEPSKPSTGTIVLAVALIVALFVTAGILKATLTWTAPAETVLSCAEILFTAVVAVFGFEGVKFLKL